MKKLTVFLALILAAAMLTACGSGDPKETAQPAATEAPVTEAPATEAPATEAPATEPPAEETGAAAAGTLADRIGNAAADAGDLVPFTADELTDMTGIAPEDYSDFVFLQGDGMDGREILVVIAADAKAGDRIEAQMQNYLERRRDENRNYAPAAYQLLSEAKVVRSGLTLAMISGADAAAETEKLLAGE